MVTLLTYFGLFQQGKEKLSRALNGARESIYSWIKVLRFKRNNTVLGRVNSEHDLAWTVAARIARHVERVPIKAAVDLWYLCSGYLYC